jgi:hypothetical protein
MIGGDVRYRLTIVRDCEFQIDIDASDLADAINKVMKTALDYDLDDQKVTKIVAIHETPKDVHHPSN